MMPAGDFSGLGNSTKVLILNIFDYCQDTPINKTMHKAALQSIVNEHVPALHIDIVLMMLEKRGFITINDSFTFTFKIVK
jgi:hypothetical protein